MNERPRDPPATPRPMRRGPMLAFAACALVGGVVGLFWPGTDWGIARRLLGGLLLGGWCGLLLTASRLLM